MQELTQGSVTSPQGFLASGIAAGIKYQDKKDVALVYSVVPAQAAAVYTLNKFKAAPLQITEQNISSGTAQVMVINSGIANAGMGETGLQQARQMSDWAAQAAGVDSSAVIVASTGVIGMPLPMETLQKGIIAAQAALSAEGGHAAAEAIMTTDTVSKEMAVTVDIAGTTVTIGAMAKGSGMIHPNMATMLSFFTSDAAIELDALQAAFKANIEDSFNMISVDGDTSTNDMVAIMANGQAGNPVIKLGTPEFEIFQNALKHICITMARKIAADGEGATKLITTTVTGAATLADAKLAAKAVITSSLVKTAVYGNDANWGRIACALGYSGASFEPDKVNIYIGSVQVAKDGMGLTFDEEAAMAILKQKEVPLLIELNIGAYQATAWGCDLTYDYVKINADYRS